MGGIKTVLGKDNKPVGTIRDGVFTRASEGGGIKPFKTKYFSKDLDEIGEGRVNNEMRSRLSNDMVNMTKRVRGASTEKEYRKIAQDYGYEFKDGMSKQDMISAARDSMRDSIKRGPSMGDRYRAYHGPAVTGVGITGLAIGTAFRVMGPKSNRELYSDPR